MRLRVNVIGSTGLVGRELVKLLLEDGRVERVVSFVRRASGVIHPKLDEHVVDFRDSSWHHLVSGDVLFSALGTTIAAAGSQPAQYEVDYTFQLRAAEAAAKAGVPTYVLVSAASASEHSRIFYSRMKGELDRDVAKLPFAKVIIVRPGLLLGEREKPRTGEKLGAAIMSVLAHVPGLRKYRGIQGRTVAEAMLVGATSGGPGVHVFEPEQVFELAEGKGFAQAL